MEIFPLRVSDILNEDKEKGMFVGVKFTPDTLDKLEKWLKDNNVKEPVPRDKLHTTILYSKNKRFPWNPKNYNGLEIDPNTYEFDYFGDEKNIMVITFDCPELSKRHEYGRDEFGIPWDYDEYKPHITLSYEPQRDELSPFTFPLKLDREYTEDFEKEWVDDEN